jgi:hypothetical protein
VIARALAVLLALALALHVVQWLRLDAAQDELAAVRAAAVSAALAYSENAREIEQQQTERIAHAQRTREQEQARNRRTADLLRTERDGLRNAISNYAAGSADDSVAACRERAATIGALLDDALRTSETCAGGAESHTGDVRALLRGWPVKR